MHVASLAIQFGIFMMVYTVLVCIDVYMRM